MPEIGSVRGRAGRLQRLADRLPQGLRHRRREGVTDLPVGCRLTARELPAVGETLDAGHHPRGQLGRLVQRVVGPGRVVGDAESVDPKQLPCLARPGRPEVGSAVLLAAAHDGRRDPPGVLAPFVRPWPSSSGHEIVQDLADRRRRHRRRLRPLEVRRPGLLDRHEHEPRPQLRHPVLAGVNNVPPGLVAEAVELVKHLRAVGIEAAGGQPAHVLEQDGARPDLRDQAERLGEQVPVILVAELFARDGEGRARHAAGQEVDAREGTPVHVVDIVFDDLPLGSAVEAERLASVRVQFDHCFVRESGLVQPE